MKTGKNFKIFGMRQSLLGDTIMSLPILNYLHKIYDNPYIYFQIAQKCSQGALLYLNHPRIDQLVISDCNEGFGQRDRDIMGQCDLVINTMPAHPDSRFPNDFNIYEETFRMAGFPIEEYYKLSPEEQRPKLHKWFNIEKAPAKTVGFWPCAGYGKENKRNPSWDWYTNLLVLLDKDGYNLCQFGHPNDFGGRYWGTKVKNMNQLPFFDQIKMSLECDLVLGTDSGAGLIIGAYDHPQISLLTNHWPGHDRNPYAFAPNNLNNINFFAKESADNINYQEVFEKIREIVK